MPDKTGNTNLRFFNRPGIAFDFSPFSDSLPNKAVLTKVGSKMSCQVRIENPNYTFKEFLKDSGIPDWESETRLEELWFSYQDYLSD